ncbi:MAG: hypothetical protein O2782_03785 [bacterium]|nr:hypothetical protein [bacterium]
MICPTLPIHLEAKRTERLNVYEALAQAIRDAGQDVPVVAHRRNGGDWIVILRLGDLLALITASPRSPSDGAHLPRHPEPPPLPEAATAPPRAPTEDL